MTLREFLKNPYTIAIGGTVVANFISANANDLSLVELLTHQISVYSWLFITVIGLGLFLLLMLIKRNREHKRIVSDMENDRLRQIEIQEFKNNTERNGFLNHQKQLTDEITKLKSDISKSQSQKPSAKNTIPYSMIDDVVTELYHEQDYKEFKNSEMFQYFGDIIYRAHGQFAFSDMKQEVVAYYRYMKIIQPSKQKPYPDCYELSKTGENYAHIYLKERHKKVN